MLLRLMSLHIDSERGRWKNEREPRLGAFASLLPVVITFTFRPVTDITSSNVFDGKLTLRDGFADVDDDDSSPDIPSAL